MKKVVIGSIVSFVLSNFLLLFIVFFIVILLQGNSADYESSTSFVSDLDKNRVQMYKNIVEDKTAKYQISEYSNIVLALLCRSSDGSSYDVMASSLFEYNTKYDKKENAIEDPTFSIDCGVQEFKYLLSSVGVKDSSDTENLKIVFQAYHVGREFVSFIKNKGGIYTGVLAEEYIKQKQLTNKKPLFADDVYNLYSRLVAVQAEFLCPVSPLTITSPFGTRTDPFPPYAEQHHCGLDINGIEGQSIYASADGEVIEAVFSSDGYGNKIVIKHSKDYSTLYAHCSKFYVSVGDKVKKGDVIAEVGNTGKSTGSHLHFEIIFQNNCIDPLPLIT